MAQKTVAEQKPALARRRTSKYLTGGPGAPGSVPGRVIGGLIVALIFLLPYVVMLLGSLKSQVGS